MKKYTVLIVSLTSLLITKQSPLYGITTWERIGQVTLASGMGAATGSAIRYIVAHNKSNLEPSSYIFPALASGALCGYLWHEETSSQTATAQYDSAQKIIKATQSHWTTDNFGFTTDQQIHNITQHLLYQNSNTYKEHTYHPALWLKQKINKLLTTIDNLVDAQNLLKKALFDAQSDNNKILIKKIKQSQNLIQKLIKQIDENLNIINEPDVKLIIAQAALDTINQPLLNNNIQKLDQEIHAQNPDSLYPLTKALSQLNEIQNTLREIETMLNQAYDQNRERNSILTIKINNAQTDTHKLLSAVQKNIAYIRTHPQYKTEIREKKQEEREQERIRIEREKLTSMETTEKKKAQLEQHKINIMHRANDIAQSQLKINNCAHANNCGSCQ